MPGSPGAWRVATVAGTRIEVAASCLPFVSLMNTAVAPVAAGAAPGIGAPGAYLVGALTGVLVYVSALLHELAHVAVARGHGHVVPSVRLSATGGRTAIDGEARTPGEELATAIVGPVSSLAVGAAALGVHLALDADGVLGVVLDALVLANLVLGLLDLVPAPPLDGGRVVKAVAWRLLGSPRRGALVAARGGQSLAVLMLVVPAGLVVVTGRSLPVTVYLVAGLLALLLWTVAVQEVSVARLRIRLGGIVVSDLARPALTVPGDLPLAEAVRRAGADHTIVTVDAAGAPLGVVGDDALLATPPERQPWVSAASVARPVVPADGVPLTTTGEQLLALVGRRPAAEYLLTDASGGLAGVLRLRDLDALARRR